MENLLGALIIPSVSILEKNKFYIRFIDIFMEKISCKKYKIFIILEKNVEIADYTPCGSGKNIRIVVENN